MKKRVDTKALTRDVIVIWSITFVGGILGHWLSSLPQHEGLSALIRNCVVAASSLAGFTVVGSLGRRDKNQRITSLLYAGVIVWLFGLINFLFFPVGKVLFWLIIQAVVIALSVIVGTAISLRISPAGKTETTTKPQQASPPYSESRGGFPLG